jgi:hypothetical protein
VSLFSLFIYNGTLYTRRTTFIQNDHLSFVGTGGSRESQHKTISGSVKPAPAAYHTRSVLGGVGISKETTTDTKSSEDLDCSIASMNETKSASLQANKGAVFSTNQRHETTQPTSAVNTVSNSVGALMTTATNKANVNSSTPPPAKDTATVLLDKVSGKTHTHTIIYLLEHKVPTFYDIERYPTMERFLNCFLIHVLNTVVRPCTQEISSYTSHVIHFPNASLTLSLFSLFI